MHIAFTTREVLTCVALKPHELARYGIDFVLLVVDVGLTNAK